MTTGSGFHDPTFGVSRRSTFQSALDYINTVVDHTGTVDFIVRTSQSDGSGALASAGPRVTAPLGFEGFLNGNVFSHATTGIDPNPSGVDGSATFDFGYTWNSELDAPTGSEFDLFSVSLHEVTHSMGFLSAIASTGVSAYTGTDPGIYSEFDSFLELGDGTKLLAAGGNFVGMTADLTSDDVFFGGANAKAANGGNAVQLFAPSLFDDGSSISHLNASGEVMSPSIGAGQTRRTYSAIEMGILADIGWTLHAVPEPSTFALVGLGSVVLVYSGWRRRRKGVSLSQRNSARLA